jgi:DUF4097 and DUF4098 domain-containing protein YvlB
MKHGMMTALAATMVTTLASAAAYADQQIDRTIDAAPDSYIEIYNTSGDIQVIGWSQDRVQVKGTLGDKVEELVLERDGTEILIKVKIPHRHYGDVEADLVISVPEKSSIEVSAVSADIEVTGVLGKQSLETVSGDVATTAVGRDVDAGSVSGDVEITGNGKPADYEAATVSGDVILTNLAGRVDAESVSGDVDIIGGAFDDVHAESVNGDLAFRAELQDGGDLSMESVNGTIDIVFTKDVSARFDIETFNGSIRNCFGPKPERTSRYSPGLELSFTVGDGDSHVGIETLNGSVNICNQ